MEETFSYYHRAKQTSTTLTELRGSLEEDKMFVRVRFSKSSLWQRVRTDPIEVVYEEIIGAYDFWVTFSHFKTPLDRRKALIKEYEPLVAMFLKLLQVPEDEHPFVFQKLFDVVEAAVSPVDPVVVSVWEVTHRIGDGQQDETTKPKFIPASRSSIQALEPVTVLDADPLSSCDICLEDYDQQPCTRLPCTHLFHVHCIVQCLEINHPCPICRYAMPTEEEDKPRSTCPE